MIPELHVPWLEASILIPLVGGLSIGLLRDREMARKVCTVIGTLTFLFTVGAWIDFATRGTFEAHDHWDAIEFVFHRDVFVIDELSAPLLPLAALQYLMTVLSTLRTKVNRFSFRWTLFSEAILLATLSCREPWVLVALLSLGGCSQAGSRHFSRLRGFGEGMFSVVSGGVAFRPMIRAQIACQRPPRLAVLRSTIC